MRKLIPAAVAALALAFAATAGAALVPGVYDPGNTGCVTSTYNDGVLHLAKNCPTSTIASAGADITGLTGQTFQSASFTLASTSQCQGGSPRFNVTTSDALFFLGCNNVTPTINSNGTATYTFTAATLAAAGQQVPTPTGTINAVSVLIDVQGTADLSTITVNGQLEKPVPSSHGGGGGFGSACKHGGWKSFTNPSFKNQGQCVSHMAHEKHHDHDHH
ncbi:MAG TPA: hypothetical protein VGG88_08825 [Gaiellaceae bacterium]|jgi:hypothetical protein